MTETHNLAAAWQARAGILKRQRVALRLSLKEVSQRIGEKGVDGSTLRDWETGASIPWDWRKRLQEWSKAVAALRAEVECALEETKP